MLEKVPDSNSMSFFPLNLASEVTASGDHLPDSSSPSNVFFPSRHHHISLECVPALCKVSTLALASSHSLSLFSLAPPDLLGKRLADREATAGDGKWWHGQGWPPLGSEVFTISSLIFQSLDMERNVHIGKFSLPKHPAHQTQSLPIHKALLTAFQSLPLL